MTAVKVKSLIINNTDDADSVIAAGFPYTSTVFSITVIPISNTQSKILMIYN